MEIHPYSEQYISVDIETSGPSPHEYSILSIGACTVINPANTFYVEIKPLHDKYTPEAMKISGLSLDALRKTGLEPADAMQRFAAWLAQVSPHGHQPVFVAFNAPFDWMFVNQYFHACLGANPFGHNALDIKAFYMGMTASCWDETTMSHITRRYLGERALSHHALQDALDQAEIFRLILEEAHQRSKNEN